MISSIPDAVERVRNDTLVYHGKMPAITASSALRLSRGNWAHYANWHVPVLVFHGTADEATDSEGSRRFYDAIPARDQTLHLVDGGYHELLNDVSRDETLRAIMEWIAQRLPPRR